MAVDLTSFESSARAVIRGTAEHVAAGVAGVTAEVRGETPRVDLEVGRGVVHHMGFLPLGVSAPHRSPDQRPAPASEHGATSTGVGFQWHGRIEVPFALTVRAAARVALEAVAKQTRNEGRVSLVKPASKATE